MVLPDYKGYGIVNLMSSVRNAYGIGSRYAESAFISSSEIKTKKNIVLMVIDGLGYEYLMRHRSFLNDKLRGRMTSVFPSTTAAALMTFVTGVAPQQHAFTSWYVNLKETGTVTAILPYKTRLGKLSLKNSGVPFNELIVEYPFTRKGMKGMKGMKGIRFIHITKDDLSKSDSTNICSPCKIMGSGTLRSFFMNINKAVNLSGNKYIYAYWPVFDSLCHHYGVNSKDVKAHFDEICEGIKYLEKKLEGTDTMLIVTADHGLVNVPDKNRIDLADYPDIRDCMTLPMCGEPRAGYFYIRPSKTKKFESAVNKHLSHYGTLHKAEDLIRKGYYGLFEPSKKLFDRIGDYVFIMNEGYVIRDYLSESERKRKHKAHHGGVSEEEMYVPLVVFDF